MDEPGTPTAVLGFLVGGVLLLVYGMQFTTRAMERAAGARVRRSLMTLAQRPFVAFWVGVLATALTQSSGATSAMLVGLVDAGLMPLAGAIVVLLGANVGSTVVVQLLALNITAHAVILVGAGAAAAMATRRTVLADVGQGCFGFGLLVLGLAIIATASAPIAASPVTADVLQALVQAPLMLAMIGALLAVLFASSAAAVGLVLVLAASGALPLVAALALTFGANVGSTAPAVLVALSGRNKTGRQLAFIHTSTKLCGAAIGLLLLGPLVTLLSQWLPTIAAQVAIAHLGFNLVLALLCAPLAPALSRLAATVFPEQATRNDSGPRYLDPEALPVPAIALGQATREILRMADVTAEMLRLSIHAFEESSTDIPARIDALDDQLDELEAAIKRYLTQLDEDRMTEEQTQRELALLYIITDLEAIGDIIDRQLMRLARRKHRRQIMFSDAGWNELLSFHSEVAAALDRVLVALAAQDPTIATEVLECKAQLGRTKRELHRRHLRRLHLGMGPSLESSAIHLELLNGMSRVLSHVSNIAHAVRGDL